MRQERSQQPGEPAPAPQPAPSPDRPQGGQQHGRADEMSDDDLDAVSGGSGPALGRPGCIYPPAE